MAVEVVDVGFSLAALIVAVYVLGPTTVGLSFLLHDVKDSPIASIATDKNAFFLFIPLESVRQPIPFNY